MMGLPYGKEIMIVGRTVTSVTDRRTDGRTDRRTDRQNYYHKDRATHSVTRQKLQFLTTSLSFDAPYPANVHEYWHNPCILANSLSALHFCR